MLTDLNTLIPANSGLQLIFAFGINTRGQIDAWAFQFSTGNVHAVLLTPHHSTNTTQGTLINQGMLRKSGGNTTNTSVGWQVDFQNAGLLNVQVGTLNFDGGGTLSNGTTTISGAVCVTTAFETIACGVSDCDAPVAKGTAELARASGKKANVW